MFLTLNSAETALNEALGNSLLSVQLIGDILSV